MTGSRLLVGLASVFGALAVVMAVLASAYRTPVPLAIALPFGATGYILWYQGTGRLALRMRERARRPNGRTRTRTRAGPRKGPAGANRTRPPRQPTGPTREEAYRTLDLDPGAGENEIKRAYREKVKTTHPDRGGDEERFKEVANAYDRLTE
ncbi:J domain-containing protein [Halalkalicoccus subterraneus]|uniref:J domain-containing protein n=1 Tax=Halalkalicoccus subterraneus TaxID=2675002 RepID=UPI000EFBAA85|nr:J domain-containing protein [Halalkalicoccus subterraneus]